MAVAVTIDGFQRKHAWAGFPLGVVYKFVDDQGSYLAVLITYYAFISLIPLLLLFTAVLGFVLSGHPQVQQHLLNSALSQFPGFKNEIGQPKGLGGGGIGLAIGLLGSLYGGLGVAQAGQNAMNVAWAVPKNSRPNPFKARARSILLLLTVGLGVILTTVSSSLGTSFSFLGPAARVGTFALSVTINGAVFMLAFKVATEADVSWRQIAPGALLAAIAWTLLQSAGSTYVNHVVRGSKTTNGVFAFVLGLLALLYLESVITVFCVEINVVRVRRLYPRALLTPFTDNVDLTHADKQAYSGYARAQRNKGFEEVHVHFDKDNKTASDAAVGVDAEAGIEPAQTPPPP